MTMRVTQGGEGNFTSDENTLRLMDHNEALLVKPTMQECLSGGPTLKTVEIETINRCNNDCAFCPVSRGHDIRTPRKMTDELFHKIIGDLSDMRYCGNINLFSNNEPLLDKRIASFATYARMALPQAKLSLLTNGLLLNRELFEQLTSQLDYLLIDNYSDNLELLPHLEELLKEGANEHNCNVRLAVRMKTQVLNSRAGNSPNRGLTTEFCSACVNPFSQMVIRPDGKISLCCNDAWGQCTLGDLNRQSVSEIWCGEEFKAIRNTMLGPGRSALERCRHCDVFGLGHNRFRNDWLHTYTNAFINIVHQAKYTKGYTVHISARQSAVALKIQALLKTHGIDCAISKIDTVVNSGFYVFTEYYDPSLTKFSTTSVGKNFIVFQNPGMDFWYLKQSSEQNNSSPIKQKEPNVSETLSQLLLANKEKRLVIFGAGLFAERLVNTYHLTPLGLVDNNSQLQGKQKFGLIIHGPRWLAHDLPNKDVIILVASDKLNDIGSQIRHELGLNNTILNGCLLPVLS